MYNNLFRDFCYSELIYSKINKEFRIPIEFNERGQG